MPRPAPALSASRVWERARWPLVAGAVGTGIACCASHTWLSLGTGVAPRATDGALDDGDDLDRIIGTYDEEEDDAEGPAGRWVATGLPCHGVGEGRGSALPPGPRAREACECGNSLADGFEYVYAGGGAPRGDLAACGGDCCRREASRSRWRPSRGSAAMTAAVTAALPTPQLPTLTRTSPRDFEAIFHTERATGALGRLAAGMRAPAGGGASKHSHAALANHTIRDRRIAHQSVAGSTRATSLAAKPGSEAPLAEAQSKGAAAKGPPHRSAGSPRAPASRASAKGPARTQTPRSRRPKWQRKCWLYDDGRRFSCSKADKTFRTYRGVTNHTKPSPAARLLWEVNASSTVFVIGDSMAAQFWRTLVCKAAYLELGRNDRPLPYSEMSIGTESAGSSGLCVRPRGVRYCLLPAGTSKRRTGNLQVLQAVQVLDSGGHLRSGDVAVVNEGLWFKQRERLSRLRHGWDWTRDLRRRVCSGAVRVIWRETTAQHFATKDGTYIQKGFYDHSHKCRPLRDHGKKIRRWNQAVLGVLARVCGISVLAALELTAADWDTHLEQHTPYPRSKKGSDCTHYCTPSGALEAMVYSG